jgi:hypothetical protein
MDAMGIYVITTGIMIVLYFTMTKNHILLMLQRQDKLDNYYKDTHCVFS